MFSFKAALPSPNVEQCDQNRSAWVRVCRPSKTVLGCKSSILVIRNRSGPDERRCFLSKLLCLARMSSNVTITGQHGSGAPRPPKTSLGCKSSILVIRNRSGPDERRCFHLKLLYLALMSSNVTKNSQHGSGSPRPSKTVLGCKSSILAIRDRSEPDERRCFLSKLLCLARMFSNVTKTGQNGSGSPRPPKSTLACKSSISVISDRSGPDERKRFFSKLLCQARMSSNVTKTGQHGSGSPRPPKTSLGCKRSILAIRDRSGPDERRRFLSKLL